MGFGAFAVGANTTTIGSFAGASTPANGVTSIGNWTGPAGWFRLLQAIDAGEAVEFLDDLGTRAVFFSPQQLLDAGIEHVLADQLKRAGYREVPLTRGSAYRLYVKPG